MQVLAPIRRKKVRAMGVISGEVPGVGREGNDSRHSEQGAPDLMIEEKGRWCELISSMGSNIMTEEVVMRGGAVTGSEKPAVAIREIGGGRLPGEVGFMMTGTVEGGELKV